GVALSALVGIVAPLIGAWSLETVDARAAFAIVGVVQATSVLPLLSIPQVRVPKEAPTALRAALPGVGLFMADGFLDVSYFLVWQIALFFSLGQSLSAYGGAMSLAALVGAVSGMLLGRHVDAGHGRRGVAIAFTALSLVLVARVVSVGTPWLAVATNAVSAIVSCLVVPVQMVPVYNLAKASPCALRFHIAAEGGWDVGHVTGCLVAAGAIALGASLAEVIPLGFIGVLALVLLLRRYYVRLAGW
ncbi:MAG: hypothetical protein ACREBE_11525, partial [bacterium]